MKALGSVFLGVSKSTQKKFYASVLKTLRPKYPILNIPCVGTFSLVDAAIEAGYETKNIFCSDVSLFSSLLGSLFTAQEIKYLPFQLGTSDGFDEEYRALNTETERVAYLIWIMKSLQLREDVFYEQVFQEYLFKSKEEILADLNAKLELAKKKYRGIHYDIRDLRYVVGQKNPLPAVTIIHAPAYANGYKKQFSFDPVIKWDMQLEEFNYKKEFLRCYYESALKDDELFIWSCYNGTHGIPDSDVFFAEEVGKQKYEYFCVTKPKDLEGHSLEHKIAFRKKKSVKPLGIPIVARDYKITKDTKIEVLNVPAENALYYRDLWAHKMGSTKAERYYLFTLDGAAFGICGIHVADVLRLVSTDIMEVFGFDQPIDAHPNSHKLFMMLLTCWDFKKIIEAGIKVNRLFEIKGFKTTCLTKYRKLKSSTGLLNIIKKERLPNGMYKLLYHTPFWKRGFKETLEVWLKDFDVQDLRKNQDEEEDDDGV